MKKAMKKLMAALLAVAMLCALAVPAFAAAGTNVGKGSITINNAVANQTYTAYKMMDVTVSGTGASKSYAYTVASGWENFFTTGAGGQYIKKNANNQYEFEDETAERKEAFAKAALDYATATGSGITGATGTTAGQDGETVSVTIDNLDLGYYVVSTSLGSLCSVGTVEGNSASINEKNSLPDIDKQVQTGTDSWGTTNDAKIGATVKYKVIVHAKKGAKDYVLTDTMTKGLTFDESKLILSAGQGVLLQKDKDYTVSTTKDSKDNTVITIKFDNTYLAGRPQDTDITVIYSATVNKDAVIYPSGNINEATLKYGNSSTVGHQTNTYSYKFDLVKTDSTGNLLTGAKFVLHTTNSIGTTSDLVKFIKVGNNNYRVADATEETSANVVTEIEVEDKAAVTISGLDKTNYWLEETAAPDGYSKMTSTEKVDIAEFVNNNSYSATINGEQQYVSGGIRIINNTGTTLPTTGGIGTTIFYVIGGGLMLAAAVLLITKKRMENKN